MRKESDEDETKEQVEMGNSAHTCVARMFASQSILLEADTPIGDQNMMLLLGTKGESLSGRSLVRWRGTFMKHSRPL